MSPEKHSRDIAEAVYTNQGELVEFLQHGN